MSTAQRETKVKSDHCWATGKNIYHEKSTWLNHSEPEQLLLEVPESVGVWQETQKNAVLSSLSLPTRPPSTCSYKKGRRAVCTAQGVTCSPRKVQKIVPESTSDQPPIFCLTQFSEPRYHNCSQDLVTPRLRPLEITFTWCLVVSTIKATPLSMAFGARITTQSPEAQRIGRLPFSGSLKGKATPWDCPSSINTPTSPTCTISWVELLLGWGEPFWPFENCY